ncbi:hypothetical protein SOVF_070350 [Spinacia oleracea]|uniref:Ribosome biogenesis protein NOP53 n=1 Tax=Spinacia oleracea TaxID=3562 RepID=A0A9R0K9H9_SPIOL|nr:uncharacterized protein LOC110801614 [Spinacia oleracea]KNA18476.1 hypothetical protein SOVF_070350 [Spinacia oleracea]
MEEDGRREASIASNPSVKSSSITQERLAKFRELQQRRLRMQSKIKYKRKSKDKKGKFLSEDVDTQGCVDEHVDEGLKDSSVRSTSKGEYSNEVSSSTSHTDVHPALKKRKLHWGLDAKERWERKANM